MVIFLIFICGIMFIQDNKFRGISWYLFPLLFIAALINTQNFKLNFFFGNLMICATILIIMTVYLSLKLKKIVLITQNYFSIGDVLFLIAITPLFNNLSYVLFINIGTFLTLIIYFLFQKKQQHQNIPFAGNMAFLLIFKIILLHE